MGESKTIGCFKNTPKKAIELNGMKPEMHSNNNITPRRISRQKKNFPPKTKIDLSFENVYYSVNEWSLKNPLPVKKEILHGVAGEFLSNELTAIMGPSGAGKSTLLNIVASFILNGASGSVRVNGHERNLRKYRKLICYIQQDDYLRHELTVIESMKFAADLKLGPTMTNQKKAELVLDLLTMLGLEHCVDTRCGKLSGGQRKRLSIALELITNPPVIFLDEPTTGLDSSSCSQCISILKLLSQQGRTVVCTIHQPSALLFEMFDKLYALASGHCIYQGPIKGVVPYFSNMNLVCPQYHNPADFLLDVASGEFGTSVNELAVRCKQDRDYRLISSCDVLVKTVNVEKTQLALEDKCKSEEEDILSEIKQTSSLSQYIWLTQRRILTKVRKPVPLITSLAAHFLICVLFGYLYRECGLYSKTVMASIAFNYGSLLLLTYTGQMPVTLSFPSDVSVFEREHFNRWYRILPYYFSVVTVDIPFQCLCILSYFPLAYWLTHQYRDWYVFMIIIISITILSLGFQAFGYLCGVIFPTTIAVFIGPLFICLMSVFGFIVRYQDLNPFFKIFYYFSFFRAGYQNVITELYGPGRTLPCADDEVYCYFKNPKTLYALMGYLPADIPLNIFHMVLFFFMFHALTIFSIWYKIKRR